MDEKMVREWLSKVAFHFKALVKPSSCIGLNLCACEFKRVQLYKCARKIIDILGIPFKEQVVEYEDGSNPNLEISFIYDDMEFFELEDCKDKLQQAVMNS